MKIKLTKQEKNWILYDVGNSAFTLLAATILPIYFNYIAGKQGLSDVQYLAYWGYAVSIATLLTALAGPVFGTVADTKGYKKPVFTIALGIGAIASVALGFAKYWLVFLIVFVIAKVGYSVTLVFYDSMLVDVTLEDRMDEVSSQGYAWGYIGSCVPFVISLLLVLGGDKVGISTPAAMTAAFFLNAAWWGLVTIPLLKNYEQKYYVENQGSMVKESFARLGRSVAELKDNKKVALFLLAFFFYIDGVYTIIEMATSYGKDVGISDANLLLALLLTQVVAFPCAILFGKMTQKFETGKLISVCIIAYFAVAVYALQLDAAWKFWMMATFVGVFQGAIQALSRSYYAKIIPKEKSSEYFGIFDIFGKGASFMGTMLMGISTQIFDTSKAGVVVIAAMFVVGFVFFQVQRRTETQDSGTISSFAGSQKQLENI